MAKFEVEVLMVENERCKKRHIRCSQWKYKITYKESSFFVCGHHLNDFLDDEIWKVKTSAKRDFWEKKRSRR